MAAVETVGYEPETEPLAGTHTGNTCAVHGFCVDGNRDHGFAGFVRPIREDPAGPQTDIKAFNGTCLHAPSPNRTHAKEHASLPRQSKIWKKKRAVR